MNAVIKNGETRVTNSSRVQLLVTLLVVFFHDVSLPQKSVFAADSFLATPFKMWEHKVGFTVFERC